MIDLCEEDQLRKALLASRETPEDRKVVVDDDEDDEDDQEEDMNGNGNEEKVRCTNGKTEDKPPDKTSAYSLSFSMV